MENQKKPIEKSFLNWLNQSLTVKMVVIAILILILLIPLSFVQNLIKERAQRQNEVINEINDKWGNGYTISGPILKIPYKKKVESVVYDKDSEKKKTVVKNVIETAYFFPETLNGKAALESKPLQRSIYKSVVYEGAMEISGTFRQPDFGDEEIKPEDILWDKAKIIINTTNLKGIKNDLTIQWNDEKYQFSPKFSSNSNANGEENHSLESGFIKSANNTSSFSMQLSFNGSEQFRLIPIGKSTQFNITSNWSDPSFIGNFLPKDEKNKVTDKGFNANWNILHYNRPFPQSFFGNLPNLNSYAFGVNLLIPVDEYQKSERSAKYGYLVIVFTFLFFFLIQSTSKINIHPFQYLMIGLALVLFYTLLISISEHSSFLKAYLIAGGSITALIGLYSKSVLKSWKFSTFITLSIIALYAFIYVIIQLESYALLVGSIGLFVILSIVMYVSRRIEWNI